MPLAMAALCIYDVVKFMLGYGIMKKNGIDPWIFLFIDIATVPGYFIGWHHLLQSMGKQNASFPALFKWGIITFYCSTGPYLYAAWTGRNTSSRPVWIILALILLVIIINIIRKVLKEISSGKLRS